MMVRVLFFAQCRDIFPVSELVEEIASGSVVADLASQVIEKYAKHSFSCYSISFAVNEEWAKPETVLKENDVVAFLPPVGGG
jgi:molybdopterin converting factor subunit 1